MSKQTFIEGVGPDDPIDLNPNQPALTNNTKRFLRMVVGSGAVRYVEVMS